MQDITAICSEQGRFLQRVFLALRPKPSLLYVSTSRTNQSLMYTKKAGQKRVLFPATRTLGNDWVRGLTAARHGKFSDFVHVTVGNLYFPRFQRGLRKAFFHFPPASNECSLRSSSSDTKQTPPQYNGAFFSSLHEMLFLFVQRE